MSREREAELVAEVERARRLWVRCLEEARRAERAWLDAVEALARDAKKTGGEA